MSSMLEEAVIDAQALKEAAQKSAEEKIIEHFSKDIKEAVDIILEQDMMNVAAPGMGATMAPTQAYVPQTTSLLTTPADQELIDIAADGEDTHEGESIVKQVPYAATTSERDIVSIDLNKLEETIKRNLQESGATYHREEDDDKDPVQEEFELGDDLLEEDDVASACMDNCVEAGGAPEDCGAACAEEEEEVPTEAAAHFRDMYEESLDLEDNETLEEMIRNILAEESTGLLEGADDDDETEGPDYEKKLKGSKCKSTETWNPKANDGNGACEPTIKDKAPKAVTENRASKKTLKEHKQLNNKVKLLEEKLNKYKEVFPQLKQQLEESNLQSARLHYQNRILNSDSLNERQKDRLVETISKANTVEEAKIIYETLQSAVGASALKRKPQSLNEVVTKSSSAFMPRKEEKRVDPLMVRMKALAGID